MPRAKTPPKGVSGVIGAGGDHLAALRAVADVLAAHLDVASPGVAPALAGQLRLTLAEIDELTAATPGRTSLDELRNRREGRGADSDAAPLAVRRSRRAGSA
jgi:hypothetical protein